MMALQSLGRPSTLPAEIEGQTLASLTIRNLEDPLKAELRVRAAHHGRSMEEEARVILRSALSEHRRPKQHLAEAIHDRFAALGGVDLLAIVRAPGRDPPDFGR
jgi:plasmid stability protein